MSSVGQEKMRAAAWDPRSPATLLVPNKENGDFRMNTFLSHDGVGCNTHETSALMELLDAYDAYLDSDAGSGTAMRSLSKAYRKALSDCIQGWEEQVASASEPNQDAQEGIELLKVSYAVTQLSETFLLVPSSESMSMDYYENKSNLPGAVTADTVRYLRLHHMPGASNFVSDEIMDEIDSSVQPDQIDEGEVYWKLMENYLVRGSLDDVWVLLSRHSLFRRSVDSLTAEGLNEYHTTTLAEDREGFRAMKALLMSAPLPGGRTDLWDAGFEQDEEQTTEEEEFVEGIPTSAYRLWETSESNRGSGDVPVHFQPHAPNQIHQLWQQAVMGLPEVHRLKRRIPQLHKVLSVLSGDFNGVEFESWAEELCAELLYKNPMIRLNDIHVRASRIMEKFDAEEQGALDEVILSVMKGNAGRVVEAMHELGGGSGAALPAVMTSLLCSLLSDAQLLPPSPSVDFSIETELLLNAASSIRSSMASEGHHDLGVRLAVRLLRPHVTVDGDVRISATLANSLEHHSPDTDAEANALLVLCRSLVERKNVRVLDGCVSIALARHRYFLSDERPGGAIHWLLTGMELESLVLCDGPKRTGDWQDCLSTGVCYRLLVTTCMDISHSMLKGLLGSGEGVSLLYVRGMEMVAAMDESELAAFVPETKLLENVVAIAQGIAEQKDDALVASNIIACLEERPNEEGDGVVACLARASMHWDFLLLAKVILDRNPETYDMEQLHLYTASFDVHGMQVLLERFTVVHAAREMEGVKVGSAEEEQEMRLALANGLMRAFVAENATKTKRSSPKKASDVSVEGIYAANLGNVSREKQELVVQGMLDF